MAKKKKVKLRYALHPGWVISVSDGQKHFISSNDLIRCYDLPANDCVRMSHAITRGSPEDVYVHLYPIFDGQYQLARKIAEDNFLKKGEV